MKQTLLVFLVSIGFYAFADCNTQFARGKKKNLKWQVLKDQPLKGKEIESQKEKKSLKSAVDIELG